MIPNSTNCNFGDFWGAEFCNWHLFDNCHPRKTWFWSSDCLVLLVVLVARAGPAEFCNWHPIYNCEVYIICICMHACVLMCQDIAYVCIHMSSRIYFRKRRVDYRVPYFEVWRSLSLANEIGTEHRTRSIHMMYHT